MTTDTHCTYTQFGNHNFSIPSTKNKTVFLMSCRHLTRAVKAKARHSLAPPAEPPLLLE